MTEQRYLDLIENNMKGFAPTQAVEFRGRIDETALRRALDFLCVRHPVMRARIRVDGDQFLLYVPDDAGVEFISIDGGVADVQRFAHEEWRFEDGVARFAHVRNGASGYLALRTDHAIFDGSALRAVFADLWRLYTDVVNSDLDVPPRAGALPASPYDLFLSRAGMQFAPSLRPTATPEPLQVCDAVERRVQLSQEETQALVGSARKHQTSVSGLVCGAVLTTLRSLSPVDGPTTMHCWSTVNLRTRVDPPIGPAETTNLSTRHKAVVSVDSSTAARVVGQQVKTQLAHAIATGDLSREPMLSPPAPVDTELEQRLATVLVSNNGVVSDLPSPSDVQIVDRLSLAYPRTVLFPTHSVYTYGGRLHIRAVLPSLHFTESEADDVAAQYLQALRAID